MDVLVRIKRLLINGSYAFSRKAETELFSDHLTSTDVVESVLNAPAITKILRSRSSQRRQARERLFVIVGSTYDGLLVYTKGAIRKIDGEDTFYFFVSSKRWLADPEERDAD
jgi:hypothetical protein